MPEKKFTVRDLLTEDNRKRLAQLLLNNRIKDMVVIYRKGNDLYCDSSDEAIATAIGMLEMAKTKLLDDWQYPGFYSSGSDQDDNKDNGENAL